MRPSKTALLALLFLAGPSPARAADPDRGDAPAKPGAAAPAASADPAAPDDESPLTRVPPGSPKDQALWKAAWTANNDVVTVRARATRLQWAAKRADLDGRLAALAKGGPPEVAGRAEKVRQRLMAAWRTNYVTLSQKWPVDPTRACQYDLLNFATAMGDTAADAAVILAQSRANLQTCLDRAHPAIRAMRESNEDLARAIAAAEGELGSGKAGSPPAGEPAGPASDGATTAESRPSGGTPPPAAVKN